MIIKHEISCWHCKEKWSIEQSIAREKIRIAIAADGEFLTPRELRILKLRFGIDDGINQTCVKIAKEFDVTRERIRDIELKALLKIGVVT